MKETTAWPPRFEDFERILGSQPTTPFFFGDDPFYCDFGVFHHVNLALDLDENLLDPYPFLSKFLSNVERLDGVKEYLDSRPELIGVGSKPQLLIDGAAKSTGVVNDYSRRSGETIVMNGLTRTALTTHLAPTN